MTQKGILLVLLALATKIETKAEMCTRAVYTGLMIVPQSTNKMLHIQHMVFD